MFIGLQKDPDFFNGFRQEVGATPLFTGTGIGVCPVNPRAAGGHKVAPFTFCKISPKPDELRT